MTFDLPVKRSERPTNTPTERDMRLKEMCADEMPRERMLAKGAMALSNVELLAILLPQAGAGRM